MPTRTGNTLARMGRQFPARTGLFTIGPVLFSLLQLLNCYLHGVSLLVAGGLSSVLVAYSVIVTRYHLAAFRRSELTASAFGSGPHSGH